MSHGNSGKIVSWESSIYERDGHVLAGSLGRSLGTVPRKIARPLELNHNVLVARKSLYRSSGTSKKRTHELRSCLKQLELIGICPTAQVELAAHIGDQTSLGHAVLDTGAEVTIITSALAKRLGLVVRSFYGSVIGVGGKPQTVDGTTEFVLRTRSNEWMRFASYVVEDITSGDDGSRLDYEWPHIQELRGQLADPSFEIRRTTDVLFGTGTVMLFIRPNFVPPINGSPWLVDSVLGWLVLGFASPPKPERRSVSIVLEPAVQYFDKHFPATTVRPLPASRFHVREGFVARCRTLRSGVCAGPSCPTWCVLYAQYRSNELAHITELLQSLRVKKPDLNSPVRPVQPPIRNLYSVVPPLSSVAESVSLFDLAKGATLPHCHDQVTPARVSFSNSPPPQVAVALPTTTSTDDLLKKLFEVESVEEVAPWTPAELEAEKLFSENVRRERDGRYVVPLPLAQDPKILGSSRSIALRQLYRLEAKFRRDPSLLDPYCKFMDEYLELGHMRPVPPPELGVVNYYLPHHAVRRPSDPADKIRVVYNASQRTSSGVSLNEILHIGPKLLQDISDVVLRFRSFRYVFIADIRQMFRQIKHPEPDQDLLRIVWRKSPDAPIQDFALTTVTYGTASAPFLANRVLRHLADSSVDSHPQASKILRYHTYVDDAHGGGESVDLAVRSRDQLVQLLKSAGLELRKWASNDLKVLRGIPTEHCLAQTEAVDLSTDEDKPLKLLGVAWDPVLDSFFFKVPTTPFVRTKRELASQVGRIYDPAGWVVPVAVFARCIQREVCHAKYEWDDPLPSSLVHDWSRLASSMGDLAQLRIPRFIRSVRTDQWLVGFADASERAYAAVIYHVEVQRSRSGTFRSIVRLVTARARIAPLKPETIPRLELLGAELLGKLMIKVRPQFAEVPDDRVVACSDSTIVLSWLTANPAPHWKVFVGNRVAKTLRGLAADRWFHVATADNPADVASRGALPHELVKNQLWWNGPTWLSGPRAEWPIRRIRPDLSSVEVGGEIRASSTRVLNRSVSSELEEKYSSFTRLRRVFAWLERFTRACKSPSSSPRTYPVNDVLRSVPPLSTAELKEADLTLVRRAQERHFSEILQALKKDGPRTKLMRQLALFRSSDGVIRVGGRLENTSDSYETRHPALLPSKDHLTELIVRQSHENCLHVGPRATLAHLRTKYWIVDGRNVVNRVLSKCVRCFSIKPKPFQPVMGNLPSGRVQRTYPFDQVGVDFAGPFTISLSGLRGTRSMPVYLAVFVCFTTKAVHLEVVMDLSSDAFLQCLERFIGRRGVPSIIWSDNGRNFLGAANLLRDLRRALEGHVGRTIVDQLATRGVQWKFIPPRAPHFGGLWEAAVKSAKRLLRTTLRDQTMTFQTFHTILIRIEAVLNSRPLLFQSESPDDVLMLTPGHFLVQRPLTALPESSVDLDHGSRMVPKWRFVNQVVSSFWKRWSAEYLRDLQAKAKWNSASRLPVVGDVCLLMEDDRPPLSWPMCVIEELITGADGVARVARVRTSNGSFTRPLVKLCPLPKDDRDDTQSSLGGEDVRTDGTGSSQLAVSSVRV